MDEREQGWIERFARLDACAVSDALDRLGLRGAVVGFRRMTGQGVCAGLAATVRLEPSDAREAGSHLGTGILDGVSRGTVIVVANGGRTHAAAWGGLLARGARLKGVAAVVVDGAIRDRDEIAETGLSVHALGAVPVSARGRFVEVARGEPVEVRGIDVEPGDGVVADGSGVVFVPRARCREVLEAAEEIAATERGMARALERGVSPSAVMDARYEELTRGDR